MVIVTWENSFHDGHDTQERGNEENCNNIFRLFWRIQKKVFSEFELNNTNTFQLSQWNLVSFFLDSNENNRV